MKNKKDIEMVNLDLTARRKMEIGNAIRQRLQEFFGGDDMSKLSLGFKLPEKFLQIDGPQPTLAQLTVLAQKLQMQIRITHLEIEPFEVESKEASDVNEDN